MAPRLSADHSDFTAPLVFVGFGITAPRFKYDDYAGMDVKGKFAVMLSDAPPSFPSEEGAHYASRRVKSKLAAEHGAVGVIYCKRRERRTCSLLPSSASTAICCLWTGPPATVAAIRNSEPPGQRSAQHGGRRQVVLGGRCQTRRHLRCGRRKSTAATKGSKSVCTIGPAEHAICGQQQQRGRNGRRQRPRSERRVRHLHGPP